MKRKAYLLLLALFVMLVNPSFAGPFSGVGGDADYFPKDWLVGSVFVAPALYFENTSGNSIFGVEGVIGSKDLSLSLKYGVQGANNYSSMGLRKKILGEDNMPFSFALVYDVEGILGKVASTNGSYIGAVFSKKFDKLFPYFALLSTTYYVRTDLGVGPITYNYIYGSGLAGGVRYDYDNHWSVRGEINYNLLSTTAAMPWPKSVMSMVMCASWRR